MIEITRRSFLATMLALGVAPAVVRASSIMRVRPMYRLHPAQQWMLAPYSAWRDCIVLEDAAGAVLAELMLTPEVGNNFKPAGLYPYPSAWKPTVGQILKTGTYARAKLYHHGGKVLEASDLELRMNTNDVVAGDTIQLHGLTFKLIET